MIAGVSENGIIGCENLTPQQIESELKAN